jgi:hypothetical protein
MAGYLACITASFCKTWQENSADLTAAARLFPQHIQQNPPFIVTINLCRCYAYLGLGFAVDKGYLPTILYKINGDWLCFCMFGCHS